jgi:uncharacterized membrane protein
MRFGGQVMLNYLSDQRIWRHVFEHVPVAVLALVLAAFHR